MLSEKDKEIFALNQGLNLQPTLERSCRKGLA
jgi:hypothetical protein